MEIHFTIETEYGNYNDTLFFPADALPSDAEVEALKNERLQAWLQHFDPSRPTPVPTDVPVLTEEERRELVRRKGM